MNIQSIGASSLSNNIDTKSLESNISGQKSFSEVITDAINQVNDKQIDADNKVEGLIKGDESITMHEVMLSMQESQLSMQLFIEVRNKIVEAYQEINKIQL